MTSTTYNLEAAKVELKAEGTFRLPSGGELERWQIESLADGTEGQFRAQAEKDGWESDDIEAFVEAFDFEWNS